MSQVSEQGDLGERSVGELISQLSEQVSQLVRDELRRVRTDDLPHRTRQP